MLKDIFPIDKWSYENSAVLRDLPKEDLEVLFANANEDVYTKGQVIIRRGVHPSGVFFIKEGKVKKFKVDKLGREHIIYVANSGELVGYHAMLAEERYQDSAATLEDCTISFIPKEDFLNVLERSKFLSQRLLKTLSHEFSVFSNCIALFAQRNVRERLAMQLVLMREKYKLDFVAGMHVEINMSRGDLASLVGTARENIQRILKEFKEEGILDTKGRKIFIKDIDKLLSIAND